MPKALDPDHSMWDWLIHDLVHLCKKYNLSYSELGTLLNRSRQSVSNIINGHRQLQDKDADILDARYNTGGHYRRVLSWARRGHSADWFREYFDLESVSSEITTYAALAVPGPLQLPEYAAELIGASGAPNFDELVERRMARQKIFERETPPLYWMIVTENVIDWPVGGSGLLKRQLKHLLEMAERPNIGLRVVPRSIGTFNGFDGSFSILSGEYGEIAYTESPGGGRLVSSPSEVRDFKIRYSRIGQTALPEAHSREMIVKAMEGL